MASAAHRRPAGKGGLSGAAALALAVAAMVLAGCPKSRPRRTHQGLVIDMEAESAHLVNMLRPDFWAHRITTHQLFESLVRLEPRPPYKPRGELASTWKVSEDHLTYTFYLRKGVTWHDGQPFSGRDVKLTFDRLLDERVNAASTRATLAPFIDRYKLIKPDQFRIVCRRVSPFFLVALADLSILPAHLLEKGDLNTHPFLQRPVGTGPFRLARWDRGRQIVLDRYDGYWGKKPRLLRIVYRLVTNPDVALKLARRGELDFIPRVRPAQWVGPVARDPIFQHEFIKTRNFPPGSTYIVLNHRRPVFADVRVRRLWPNCWTWTRSWPRSCMASGGGSGRCTGSRTPTTTTISNRYAMTR